MRKTLNVWIFITVSGVSAAQDEERFYVSPFGQREGGLELHGGVVLGF